MGEHVLEAKRRQRLFENRRAKMVWATGGEGRVGVRDTIATI